VPPRCNERSRDGVLRAVPADEATSFRALLVAYGLPAEAFHLHEEELIADYGPAVRLLFVTGPTCAAYSRADGDWIAQLEAHLSAGFFELGEE
jgi:hypothetical protein